MGFGGAGFNWLKIIKGCTFGFARTKKSAGNEIFNVKIAADDAGRNASCIVVLGSAGEK